MSTLSLGGPGVACSSMRVRRLLAGELLGAERTRAEEHLLGCSRCQATRSEVEGERAALARALPFERFAAGVAERLAERPARPARRFLPLAVAAGVAAAVALPLALRGGPDREPGERLKGTASLALYALERGAARPLPAGEPVPAGASLRVALSPGMRRYAAVALVDDDGVAALYAGPARPGPLPDSFEWTGKSREGTLVLVLSDRPVDVPALQARLARGLPAAPPAAEVEVVLRPLRREALP